MEVEVAVVEVVEVEVGDFLHHIPSPTPPKVMIDEDLHDPLLLGLHLLCEVQQLLSLRAVQQGGSPSRDTGDSSLREDSPTPVTRLDIIQIQQQGGMVPVDMRGYSFPHSVVYGGLVPDHDLARAGVDPLVFQKGHFPILTS